MKLRHAIQIAVSILVEDVVVYEAIEVGKVTDHAGIGGWYSAHSHFDDIVMAMSKRIIAFAINSPVLFLAHGFAM